MLHLRVLREHVDLPKPRQAEFMERIVATIFAVNSTWQATVQAKRLELADSGYGASAGTA